VLEATWNLALNPSRTSTEERWRRALVHIGLPKELEQLDAQDAIQELAMDRDNRSSIVSSVAAARENASQVREEISSEMWEQLNRLYHRVTQIAGGEEQDAARQIITEVQSEAYRFKGVTDSTMNHGEGYHFLRFGKYSERACALSLLLDAYFSALSPPTDLDWIGLLTSCAAWEAYCKAYTADLRPELVAEFILLHPQFPYSVRYSADQMRGALETITDRSPARKAAPIELLAGKLRAALAYTQIEDVMGAGLHPYLNDVIDQCRRLQAAVHEAYIEYPVEAALQD
jgi:uncharacterized alpha-E superfamily protein